MAMKRKAAKKKVAKKKVAKKKAARRPAKKKAAAMEMLLVGSKVKAALRSQNVNVSADSAEALNQVVYWYIDQAAKRASANGRKTVRPYDFVVG